jgi:hypothetical protein
MRLRKQSSGRRWSVPPVEEAPQTWSRLVFFPFSVIALAFMAVLLLIYVCLTWLFVEPEPRVWPNGSAPTGAVSPPLDGGAPFRHPVPTAEKRAGGIVIEK